MENFVNPYAPKQETAEEFFDRRSNIASQGQQAFQQSQKEENDTIGNGFWGHMVDSAQANAAGLFSGQLRALDEGLNWAGEKLGITEKTDKRDKSGWLEKAAQRLDAIQARNTAQQELTGLDYLGQQVGAVLGSMLAMTAETAALGGFGTVAGVGAKTAGVIKCAQRMWSSNYLKNFYRLQMMNSPMEALAQGGNLLKQMEDEGYDRDTVRAATFWSSAMNAAFLPVANMVEGKMASAISNVSATNALGKDAVLKLLNTETKNTLGKLAGRTAAHSLYQGFTEGGEEAVQDYIDQYSKQLAQGKDFNQMEWDHATPMQSFVDAAVGSAALGALGSGVSNYNSKARNFKYNGHHVELDNSGRNWTVDGQEGITDPKAVADILNEGVSNPEEMVAPSEIQKAMASAPTKTQNVSDVNNGEARPVVVGAPAEVEEETTEASAAPKETVENTETPAEQTVAEVNPDTVESKQDTAAATDETLAPEQPAEQPQEFVLAKSGWIFNTKTHDSVPLSAGWRMVNGDPTHIYNINDPSKQYGLDDEIPKSEPKVETKGETKVDTKTRETKFTLKDAEKKIGKNVQTYRTEASKWIAENEARLDKLKAADVITQEEYDAIKAGLRTSETLKRRPTVDLMLINHRRQKENVELPSNEELDAMINAKKTAQQEVDNDEQQAGNPQSQQIESEVPENNITNQQIKEGENNQLTEEPTVEQKAEQTTVTPTNKSVETTENVTSTLGVVPENLELAPEQEPLLEEPAEEPKVEKELLEEPKPKDKPKRAKTAKTNTKATPEAEVKVEPADDYEDFIENKVLKPLDEKIALLPPKQAAQEKRNANMRIEQIHQAFDVVVNGKTLREIVKDVADDAIKNNSEEANAEVLEKVINATVKTNLQDFLNYYNYLLTKYNTNQKKTNKAKVEKGPDDQAQKITEKRDALLKSYIKGSLDQIKPGIELTDEVVEKLKFEFNKKKYDNKVKKQADKGTGDILEFLDVLQSIDPDVLDTIVIDEEKTENGVTTPQRTLRDFYVHKQQGNPKEVVEQLVLGDDEIDIQKIKDKAQKKIDAIKKRKNQEGADAEIKQIQADADAEIKKVLSDQKKYGISSRLMALVNKSMNKIMGGNIAPYLREDMEGVGRLAVIQAANTYDTNNAEHATFLTWARNGIENELRNYLTDNTHTVKISPKDAVALTKYKRAHDQLKAELGEEPTQEQIAKSMDLTVEEVSRLQVMERDTSMLQKETKEKKPKYDNVEDDGSRGDTGGFAAYTADYEDVIRDQQGEDVDVGEETDDSSRASLVQAEAATQADTKMRESILTKANEETVVGQIQKLFGGYKIKEVSPHVYDISLPNKRHLRIDMTTTSAQLIDEAGNQIGTLMKIADLEGNVEMAGLYSTEGGVNLVRVTDAVRNGTLPHEVAHFIFNAIFSDVERKKLLDYYKTKIKDRAGLTEEELTRRAEEMFCDAFADFFLNDKTLPKSKLQRMFEKMKRFLRKLVDMFTFKNHPYDQEELDLRRGDVNVDDESLAALFGRMANGDIYNRGIEEGNNPVEAVQKAQLVNTAQASRLPEGKALVEKAREMYSKGATDQEVWSETSCIRYKDGTIKLYVPFSDSDIVSNGLPQGFNVERDAEHNKTFPNPFSEGGKYIKAKSVVTVNLSDMLAEDNVFFKMVPSLKDVKVEYIVPIDSQKDVLRGAGGYEDNVISIVVDNINEDGTITFNQGVSLAHELQHAIQQGTDADVRDKILGFTFKDRYAVDPNENEARFAENTFIQESEALHDESETGHSKENYLSFTKKADEIVRSMAQMPILRNRFHNLITQADRVLKLMSQLYSDDSKRINKEGVAYIQTLKEPWDMAMTYVEANSPSSKYIKEMKDVRKKISDLADDYNRKQAELIRGGEMIAMPNTDFLGEAPTNVPVTYQGDIITKDANGKVRVTIDDVPTINGKPTPDELSGAVFNANRNALKHYRKGHGGGTIFDQYESADENNKFSYLDLLRSSFRLAKKFPKVFAFFEKVWDKAYEQQNKIRYGWHNAFNDALKNLQTTEDYNIWNGLMLQGDKDGVDYTEDQLKGMVYYTKKDGTMAFSPSDAQFIEADVETHELPENIAQAYLATRELSNQIYNFVDRVRRTARTKTTTANLKRILAIVDPNNKDEDYVEIKGSDGEYHSYEDFKQYLQDGEYYDIRYAEIRHGPMEKDCVSKARLEEMLADPSYDKVTYLVHPFLHDMYDVAYVHYMPHMGYRHGHVPHIFEQWMVAYTDAEGHYVVKDSKRTLKEAEESMAQLQQEMPNAQGWVCFPKAFDFGAFMGDNENKGGGVLATKQEKDDIIKDLMDRYKIPYAKAKDIAGAAVRTTFKNRIYGQAVHRKEGPNGNGVEGFSKDVVDAIEREITAASRYCALQPAKFASIDRYEQIFGVPFAEDADTGKNPLQGMIKKYINDCNGMPSTAERLLNRSLNNWKWFRENISASYGDRAVLSMASKVNQVVSMAKLGFWNISSAIVNLLQSTNTMALCGFDSFGKGLQAYRKFKTQDPSKLSGAELDEYMLNKRIIEQTGVLYDIGMDSAMGYQMRMERLRNKADLGTAKGFLQNIYDWYMRIGERGMGLFSAAEGANRQICVLAAYRDGISKGMSHEDAIAYAREVNKKANFDYGVADTPAFMRALSGTGIGELMMLFQKYPVKELELMCEMAKKAMSDTTGEKAQAARFWGLYFLMSGIGGIPGLDALDEWLEHIFGYKPSKRAKLELIDTFGDNALTRSVCYGVGAAAGVDISSRVGLGDLKFGNSQLMFPLNIGGAAGSTLKQMIQAAMEGDVVHMAKAFSPSIGAVLEAKQGFSTDQKGRARNFYTFTEQLIRAPGFRPVEDSLANDLSTALREERGEKRDEKSALKYRMAFKQTQGQQLTADDQAKLRKAGITGTQLRDARKQIKQSFVERQKALMTKEQRKRYGKVYEELEQEEEI